MTSLSRALLLVTAFVTAGAVTARAQEAPLPLARLSGPIVLDGTPDEPAWERVPSLPLTMYSPVFRGRPTQRTEIRVAYDDDYFYAAGWFFDRTGSYDAAWIASIALAFFAALVHLPIRDAPVARLQAAA